MMIKYRMWKMIKTLRRHNLVVDARESDVCRCIANVSKRTRCVLTAIAMTAATALLIMKNETK